MELVSDASIAEEIRALDPAIVRRPARRRLMGLAGLAAAAAVVLLLVRPHPATDADGHRGGPTITAGIAPRPANPLGEVIDAHEFRWTSVDGADRYRITLFDATGKVLFQAQVSDTTATVPDSVSLLPDQSYLWKVEARTTWDRWTASELTEFRLEANSSLLPPSRSVTPAQDVSISDSLRFLAPHLSDAALAEAVRLRPLEVREAVGGSLARSLVGDSLQRHQALATARRIATAYASTWHDDFLNREVGRFIGWKQRRRAAKVEVDSLRRIGIAAYSRDGASTATIIWNRAYARAAANADSAGMAATLGNIGAALSRDGKIDSAAVSLERSRAIAAAIGDQRVEANALAELAGVREARNDPSGARQLYAQAIVLRQRIGDSRGLAADYNNLASLARSAGDFDEARRQLEAALALNRRDGRAEVAATNLVNLASLASLNGEFGRAATLYHDALATWRKAEAWADAADALQGLGALELRRGDYLAAGADLQQALVIYDRTGPLTDAVSVRQQLAAARAASGDLQGALDELRRTQRLADSARVSVDVRGRITLARADLARQLNARPEAERLYAGAEQLYRRAGNQNGQAEAQQGRGMLLLEEDDQVRGQSLLATALRTEIASGDARAASLTRLILGGVSLELGDTGTARKQMARAAQDLERLGDPIATAAALGERGSLEAGAGLPVAAESLFRAALARAGDRLAPDVTWRLHAGLGAVRQRQGDTVGAVRELGAAITDIERAGRSLSLAERRSGYFTDKWEVYVRLAMLEQARGHSATAFAVSERVRAGEMLDMLAQGRVAAPTDTAAELVAQEQDLRRRITELTLGAEAPAPAGTLVRGPDVSGSSVVRREALLHAQEAYAELMLEMREVAPGHAALVSRAGFDWHGIARRLAADEAMIEYLVSDSASLAFVVTRDTLATIDLHVGGRELTPLVDFARGTLQPRGSSHLDSLWRAPLRQLYSDLVQPIQHSGLLEGKNRLTIVPHADLHYLPFAALLNGDGPGREKFLIQEFEIALTPSASVWLALGARRTTHAAEGTLALAPRTDALPASRAEVAAIARIGGTNTRIVLDAEATEAEFRRVAPAMRVIHLATYGVLNKQNPLFSFVELRPGGGEDGRLEVHEVFGLDLAADLVVLSACQTGLGSGALTDVPAGDDWIGLTRAFLSAGASHVMATLWPVQDRASAELMEGFSREYGKHHDPARALATAQRSLIGNPRTSSPYLWAGFEVVGGR
ncbi:MAG: CHAT domain-containing tetratricopeptide repeat protein [Gemmatimonadota bacterium]